MTTQSVPQAARLYESILTLSNTQVVSSVPKAKVCKTCGELKPLVAFTVYPQRPLGLRTCKKCYAAKRATRVAIKRAWMDTLKTGPCTDCGLTLRPLGMDWDHVRGTKFKNVSLMVTNSKEQILAEIAKCELVCAACHRHRSQAKLDAERRARIDARP